MKKIEFFYDYICPFCNRGYNYLKELIDNYPDIEIDWHPCEVHPVPETFSPHTDVAIQSMYLARDKGVDMWAYNSHMFKSLHEERIDVEKVPIMSQYIASFVDTHDFEEAIENKKYLNTLKEANKYAYETIGLEAVPHFKYKDMELESELGVGVSKEQLKDFLDKVSMA